MKTTKQNLLLSAFLLNSICAWSQITVDFQLLQRDAETGKCRVSYPASSGDQLRVYADDQLQATITEIADESLTAEVDAGLVEYKFELVSGGNVTESADRVACGETLLIYGQSNAEGGYGTYTYRNDFIRTYRGSWKTATNDHAYSSDGIGTWGMHFARLILEKHSVPVGIINGARGGYTIEQLSPGYQDERPPWGNDYKRMLAFAEGAGLTSAIRTLIWHQGENNMGDPEGYDEKFLALRESLYNDYPGLEKLFLFQIRTGCGEGLGVSLINEQIRDLGISHEDIEVMTTLSYGIMGCHYSQDSLNGYQIIAEDMFPLVDMALYGSTYETSQTPPDVLQVAWTSAAKNELVLQFDQEVKWNETLEEDPNEYTHRYFMNECGGGEFPVYLKDAFAFDTDPAASDKVASGRAEGDFLYLQLTESVNHTHLAYPPGNLSGCYPGPYITRPDSSTGAMMFYVEIKDELDSTVGRTSGCKDPRYVEYDSTADLHDSAACLTLEIAGRQVHNRTVIIAEPNRRWIVSTSMPGLKQVHLLDLRGRTIHSRSGTQDLFEIPMLQPPGMYFLSIEAGIRRSIYKVTGF